MVGFVLGRGYPYNPIRINIQHDPQRAIFLRDEAMTDQKGGDDDR
jgi:hypothetical protein